MSKFKKVLLTGANGFIGRHSINKLLSMGYEVHAVSRTYHKNKNGIIWHHLNLMEQDTCYELFRKIRPTHLLHLAWNTKPKEFWTTSENLDWIKLSIELLKNFANHGGERVVMAGSCAEYDWSYGWCSENITPLKPNTLYGVTKNALQSILNNYSREFNLSSAWGRIFFLFGEYEKPKRLVSELLYLY